MAGVFLRTARLGLIVSMGISTGGLCLLSQQPAGTPVAAAQPVPQDAPAALPPKTAQTRAQLRAQRRARRLAAQQSTVDPAPQTATLSAAAQRERDQKILDQNLLDKEKAQSAETARENDAVTRKQVNDQQRVQAEPRIQDAPGPGAQPLPGDPALQPAQPTDPPRIQDAPGPSQTLPKAPPPAPAPQP